jgi:hypothetical protein
MACRSSQVDWKGYIDVATERGLGPRDRRFDHARHVTEQDAKRAFALDQGQRKMQGMRHSAELLAVNDDARGRSNTRRFVGQIWRDYDQGATLPERFGNTREGRTEPKRCYRLVKSHAPGFTGSENDIYRWTDFSH